jgi:hypothetical protein
VSARSKAATTGGLATHKRCRRFSEKDKNQNCARRGVAAALSLITGMAELRQGFVEVVGQKRHAEQI